eukprot:m.119478 g.119478  ORF g.119478 m.119478 type:complete len:345 (+) comp17240_c0_seq1:151-1185(+)
MGPTAGWQPRLLQAANAMRFTQIPRFGRQLRLDPKPCDDIVHTTFSPRKNGLNVCYIIPAALCIAPIGDTISQRMPASGLLALFDHLSTYAISEIDRTHRPGVSLTLSIELVPQHEQILRSGSELHFACDVEKAGKSVSFISGTVSDAHGNLVATCRHTKYMPLPYGAGLVWAAAFGIAKPFTDFVAKVILSRIKHPEPTLASEDLPVDQLPSGGHTDAKGHASLVNDLTELVALRGVVNSDSSTSASPCIRGFSPALNVRHTNPLGGLHGGCQAMFAELLAAELMREKHPSTVLRSIHMEYLRGGSGAGMCSVEAQLDGMGGVSCHTLDGTNAVLSHGKFIWK